MDPYLIDCINKRTPHFNKDIANGLAVKHMMEKDPKTGLNNTRAYIDKLFAINASIFPKGFRYLGNSLCTPEEHFDTITREYGSRRVGNIAKSDTYMVQLNAEFNGERLEPRKILLPFVRDGNLCTLNGATYTVSPVLTDVGFSVLNGSIFIPFRRIKLTFKQVDHHFYRDGKREVTYVIWSQIHHEMGKRTKKDLDARPKIYSSLAHYFFCNFGVKGTFKQWANVDLQIGYAKDFPESKYPRSEWIIYESINLKEKHPTGDMALVIPRSQETDFVKRLVVSFWYTVDAFPNRFVEPEYLDNSALWRILLAHMVFGDFEHQGKITEQIDSHLESVNNYLDEMTMDELQSIGLKVNNIWDLLYEIMTTLAYHLYDSDIDETSMYGKRLAILRYVMAEFNYVVSMFSYAFQSRQDKEWNLNDINNIFKSYFKLNGVIRRLTADHGEFDVVSSPGDSKVIKVTSILVPQDRARTSAGHRKSLISDTSRLIHASIAEVGQYKNQPKSNPDGRGRLNLFVNVRYDGLIERNPKFRALIDRTQRRLNPK